MDDTERDAMLQEMRAMRQELQTIRKRTPPTFDWLRVAALFVVVLVLMAVFTPQVFVWLKYQMNH